MSSQLSTLELERLAQQAYEAGRWRRAEQFLTSLLQHSPSAHHWFMLGVCRHQTGNLEPALEAFAHTLLMESGHQEALYAAISLSSQRGDLDAARGYCSNLLRLVPNDPRALTTTAVVLDLQGSKPEALAHCDAALAAIPDWFEALLHRGALLLELDRVEEAEVNNRQLLDHYPDAWQAHFNFAEACLAAQKFSDAITHFQATQKYFPGHVRSVLQEAYAWCRLGEEARAQTLFDQAWLRAPDLVRADWQAVFPGAPALEAPLDARTMVVGIRYERMESGDSSDESGLVEYFSECVRTDNGPGDFPLGFRALACGLAPELQLRLARRIASGFEQQPSATWQDVSKDARIRIGYISPDFGNHAVGQLCRKLFETHDRQKFEVYGYAIGPRHEDSVRDEIELGCDQFRELTYLDDSAAAARIAADGIEILVDLAGYTDYARPGVLSRRPAPIQMLCMGYPGTTGAAWMDYLVLDASTAVAGMDRFCSEKIICLPHSMYPCSYADAELEAMTRRNAGLPDDGIILAAFHNPYKIDKSIFSLWMRLLLRCRSSYLWLPAGSPAWRDQIEHRARCHGVDVTRLLFAPRLPHDHHLARLALADLLLDTSRYNGGATVCDALVAGVPVLTCAGESIAQRMAAGLLYAAEFSEGVTASLEEYEQRAQDWLSESNRLAKLRQDLRQRRESAPFYRLQAWVDAFEAALQKASARARAGLPPVPLQVDAGVAR